MSSAQNRRWEVSYFICVYWKSSVKPQWTSEPFQSQFQFSCVCVCVCVEEDGTDTHTCTSFFNGWIAPIVLAAAVITPAAGVLSFSFSGHNTAPCTLRWAQCVMQLWQEYSHLPEDFTKLSQPLVLTFKLQTMKRRTQSLTALLIIMNFPHQLQWGSENVRLFSVMMKAAVTLNPKL